jgi:hypothetical protein
MSLRVANFPFLSAINLKVKILLQRPYFESEVLILIAALAQKASDFSNTILISFVQTKMENISVKLEQLKID